MITAYHELSACLPFSVFDPPPVTSLKITTGSRGAHYASHTHYYARKTFTLTHTHIKQHYVIGHGTSVQTADVGASLLDKILFTLFTVRNRNNERHTTTELHQA